MDNITQNNFPGISDNRKNVNKQIYDLKYFILA